MGNFLVGNGSAILVSTRHQVPDHILRVLLTTLLTTLANDVNISLGQLALRGVTLAVVRQWGPGQHEVNRGKTHIQIVIHFRKGRVESVPNFFTLQRAGGSIDGDFRNDLRDIECSFRLLESGGGLDKIVDFVGDQGNVRAQRLGGETEFDELLRMG